LATYFPDVSPHQIHILLNCDIVTFNPGTIIAKEGEMVDYIYLLLSGTTEMIQTKENIYVKLSAGALICDYSSLLQIPITETYTTLNYVKALKIPMSLYQQFIKTNKLFDDARKLVEKRRFIGRTELLGEDISYPIQNKIISSIKVETFKKDCYLKEDETNNVLRIIVDGEVERYYKDKKIQILKRGDYFGGLSRALKQDSSFDFKVKKNLKTYKIPFDVVENIPIIRWKMFEKNEILKQKINF